jgi:CubicO group peptidase (beta-lactamase class C family)
MFCIASANAGDAIDDESVQRIDSYLERLVPFGFSGAVLIADGNAVVLDKGYGWANAATDVANTADTLFPIESITKQFTAAMIMKLEMHGKLVTSDSITKFFEDVPDDKTGISIHHLLTHTSGIVTGTEEYFEDNTKEGIVRMALNTPLLFLPGERDAYSNIGYALLAAIVENICKMSFDDCLTQSLFEPAGMQSTGYRNPNWPSETIAHRHLGGVDNGTVLDGAFPDWNWMGAARVSSTTGDMYRWHQTLLGSQVFSDAVKEKMYTPFANGYGYGWIISDTEYGLLLEHDGGSSQGTAADFRRYIDKDIVIMIFCNNDGEYMLYSDRLRDSIRDLAFGVPLAAAPEASTSATDEIRLEKYARSFSDDASLINVSKTGDMLEISGVGQSAVATLLGFDSSEAAAHARVSQRSAKILQELLDQNYQSLRSASSGTMAERLESLFTKLSDSLGDVTDYSVLGTVPPTGVNSANFMTIFQVHFGDTTKRFRFYWSDDGIIALGGAGMPEPVRIRAIPAEGGEFAGYHIPTSRSVMLTFDEDAAGNVTGISVGSSRFIVERDRVD